MLHDYTPKQDLNLGFYNIKKIAHTESKRELSKNSQFRYYSDLQIQQESNL